jgi:hypothetical protein
VKASLISIDNVANKDIDGYSSKENNPSKCVSKR